VARLVEYKKVDDLIRAVKIIKNDIPDLQCKIVGTGPMEKKLKHLSRELDLEDTIEFCGFVEKHENVLKIINSSHIFCLPSIVEGFGIVIVEAMGCGVPFVAAEIPPVMEASNEKGGLFFQPENWKDLAEKLKYILNNHDVYENLQKEGLSHSKKYTGEYVGRELEILYKKLMD
jgi:glycosyltransferase involved in cell wall biosynthesis